MEYKKGKATPSPNQGKSWSQVRKLTVVKTTAVRVSILAIPTITKERQLLFGGQKKTLTAKDIVKFLKRLQGKHTKRHVALVMDQLKMSRSQDRYRFCKTTDKIQCL